MKLLQRRQRSDLARRFTPGKTSSVDTLTFKRGRFSTRSKRRISSNSRFPSYVHAEDLMRWPQSPQQQTRSLVPHNNFLWGHFCYGYLWLGSGMWFHFPVKEITPRLREVRVPIIRWTFLCSIHPIAVRVVMP